MEYAAPIVQDLLTEEYPFFEYNKAAHGQRFLNFIIDNIIIRIALAYATGLAVGYILALLSPEFAYSLSGTDGKARLLIVSYIVVVLNYLLYYTLSEALFKGKTIGKLITGTKAVRENGEELSLKDAFLRSACRLIPFEPLSGFGILWHDSFTNTLVIKSR